MLGLTIGDRRVGPDEPCFVIAEAGVNHNGDLDLARRLIDVAADAGADAIKFQTFSAAKVAAATAQKADYQKRNDGADGNQLDMLSRLELSHEAFAELAAYCRERGIAFMSTAFDHDSLAAVARLEPPALKWPSGEIDNFPLLDQAAGLGLPVILSTGMATIGEIDAALERLKRGGCNQVAIMHCVSNYPAAPEDQNLNAIRTLAAVFGRPVGYSDHTMGLWAPLAARAVGMCVLEKHFTLDRSMSGPDHKASLEPAELREMIAQLRLVEAALGDGVKVPTAAELRTKVAARRSFHATRAIAAGETLSMETVIGLRPSGGIPLSFADVVLGRKAARDISACERLDWADIA